MVESNSKVNMKMSSSEEKETPVEKPEICLDNDDDKSHTFRRRRLATLTKHQLAPEDTADGSDSEKSRTFRDRRLTLPHSPAASEASSSHSHKKKSSGVPRKKLKITSTTPVKSRVHHAGHLPPASPKTRLSHPLYQAPFVEEQPLETEEERSSKPAWRHRHTFSHDESDCKLPFPRSVVGTYSCHGVEPVYDDDDDECYDEDFNEEGKLSAKINQDRGGVAYPYAGSHQCALFAAYDGHGQGGELVSQFALHEIQKRLEAHADFHDDVEKAFKEIFVNVDSDLTKEPLIDPLYAGTTACVVLICNRKMTISNAGDSRAVVARKHHSNQNNKWKAMDLSTDQNPDVPEEQERIEKSGGFVSPPPEPGLSARVWLDNNHSQIGLAMARSIGDHAVASVGVIAEPVVTFHDITQDDDFLILATDGVWEFIDSDEAVQIVGDNMSDGATKACQTLIEAAASKWHQEEGNYRDDITALVVRLQDLWSGSTDNNNSSS